MYIMDLYVFKNSYKEHQSDQAEISSSTSFSSVQFQQPKRRRHYGIQKIKSNFFKKVSKKIIKFYVRISKYKRRKLAYALIGNFKKYKGKKLQEQEEYHLLFSKSFFIYSPQMSFRIIHFKSLNKLAPCLNKLAPCLIFLCDNIRARYCDF